MENKFAIREEVSHAITVGDVNVVIDSNQLKLLSLYLTFAINESSNNYPFILKAINGQQVLFKRDSNGVEAFLCALAPEPIFTGYLFNDDMKDLSLALETYSANNIHAPTIYSYIAYHNNDYAEELGGWTCKDEHQVVHNTPVDVRHSCGLFIDNDKEFIYGVSGVVIGPGGIVIPERI